LVVAGEVKGELAEEFSGGCVDDADGEVVDEFEDWGSGVLGTDADVVESACAAQGEFARVDGFFYRCLLPRPPDLLRAPPEACVLTTLPGRSVLAVGRLDGCYHPPRMSTRSGR
jgi:hypothetical protein